MTTKEREIIRSTLDTLTTLVYGLKKRQDGLTQEEITELEGYEETLKGLINQLSQ